MVSKFSRSTTPLARSQCSLGKPLSIQVTPPLAALRCLPSVQRGPRGQPLPPRSMRPPEEGRQYLSQDEGHHVRGLPVAGVEEVRQGHGGEGGEDVGAVQGVVDALAAPPLGGDCGSKREARSERPARGFDPRGSVGPRGPDPGLDVPLRAQVGGQSARLRMSSGKCAAPPPPSTPPSPLAYPPLPQDVCCKLVPGRGPDPRRRAQSQPRAVGHRDSQGEN